MAQIETKYVISGSTKGFADVTRAVSAANKLLEQAQRAQAKSAADLAAALGMVKERAKDAQKAVGGVGQSGGVHVTGTIPGLGGAGRAGRGGRGGASGDINSILDAFTKFGQGGQKQKLSELSEMFRKLRMDALAAADAINQAGAAMPGGGGGAGAGIGGTGGGGGGGGGSGSGGGGGGGSGGGGSGGTGGPGPGGIGMGGGGAARPGRAGFTQGFLEGVMPGGLSRIIDRGPGAWAQAGGIAAGNLARSVVAAPFNGAAGLGGVLNAIPVAGPALGGLASRAFAQSSSALQHEAQEQALRPFLGDAGLLKGKTLAPVYSNARRVKGGGLYSYARTPEEFQIARESMARDAQNAVGNHTSGNALGQYGLAIAGKNFNETQSFAADFARGSGQTLSRGLTHRGVFDQDTMNYALAANTVYGISAQTSGRYERMRMANMRGGGARGMGRDIDYAQAMGIGTPDIGGYVDQNASAVDQFNTTGFAPNNAAVGQLGATFKDMHLGSGLRAANSARGLEQYGQNLGQSGPQNGLDLMAMQELGGYKGGGADDALDAMQRLRSGDLGKDAGKNIAHLVQRVYTQSGGGKTGHLFALRAAQHYGLAMNDKDISRITNNIGNENFGVSKKVVAQAQRSMIDQSADYVGENTRQSKTAENRNLDIGERITKAVLNLEQGTDNITEAFAARLGPALTRATGAIEGFTGSLGGWALGLDSPAAAATATSPNANK